MADESHARKQYDESALYDVYCLHDGKVQQIIRTIHALSPEEQLQYPSEMTLYRYEQQFHWKERFKKIKRSVEEHAAQENAMVWSRINKAADLVSLGLLKRLTDALQRSAAGEEGALDVFTADLFYKIWEIQRTERGLSTRVSEQQARFNIEPIEERARTLEQAGLGKVADYIRKASPAVLRRILQECGADQIETPAILR